MYFCSQDLQTVIENLTYDVKNVLTWFKINSMRANPEKFQFMILSKSRRPEYNFLIGSNVIKVSTDVEFLGLIIDNKLSFEKHIAKLCHSALHKLHARRQIRKYLTLEKARALGNAFVDSQFNYASLIWMFCKKIIYFKMQKIPHKTLRIIYQSDESYENLLNLDNSVSLHQRHLRFLVTKIFKSVSKTNPKFMWSYFSSKNLSYNLRKRPSLSLSSTMSTVYRKNFVHFKGTIIWSNFPYFVKSSASVFEFKRNLKTLGIIDYLCLICKN